jgi:hypothetical protein
MGKESLDAPQGRSQPSILGPRVLPGPTLTRGSPLGRPSAQLSPTSRISRPSRKEFHSSAPPSHFSVRFFARFAIYKMGGHEASRATKCPLCDFPQSRASPSGRGYNDRLNIAIDLNFERQKHLDPWEAPPPSESLLITNNPPANTTFNVSTRSQMLVFLNHRLPTPSTKLTLSPHKKILQNVSAHPVSSSSSPFCFALRTFHHHSGARVERTRIPPPYSNSIAPNNLRPELKPVVIKKLQTLAL